MSAFLTSNIWHIISSHIITFLWKETFINILLFSHSVMSKSLRPHGLQHARLLCPSPSPRGCSNSCPLSRWCHLILCRPLLLPSSFPASGSFQMSQFFASGGQRIRVSASASILPMNVQHWFPLGWTGWISLQCFLVIKISHTLGLWLFNVAA